LQRRIRRSSQFAVALCVFSLVAADCSAATPAPSPGFAVEELAPGVYALIRSKPPGFLLDANVVFVINDEDVLVVDSNLTPSSAEASIAALRRITDKPVRYLVNTHRHADHTTGNAVYRQAFPQVEIIGHPNMRADLLAKGGETLPGWIGWAKEMTEELPKALASGTSFAGTPLTDEQRTSYAGDLDAAREIVADGGRMQVVAPTLTVGEQLTLERGGRRIEIRALGKSHTHGDLVVWLPKERIVAAGDLVTAPVPLIGADQSFVEEWAVTLTRLAELQPLLIVPGHGPVLRDGEHLQLYRAFLLDIASQTKSAMARGENAEQAAQSIDVTTFRERMAGDSPVLRSLFANWGRVPAVGALFRVREESANAAKP
jgi:cyclase